VTVVTRQHRPARSRSVLSTGSVLLTGWILLTCWVVLTGCSATVVHETGKPAASTAVRVSEGVRPPPSHARFDYQIGQPYPPPAGVRVVTRDRAAAPVPGLYNICYVNAYQAQAEQTDWWLAHHRDLLLTGVDGRSVRDPQWNELLLDISTPGKRTEIAEIVGQWIDGCARAGFNAVEPDNLDSWTRSDGRLTAADALAFGTLIIHRAHADGLAIAQKNAAEIARQGHDAGFDFAVAEQCADNAECSSYTAAYGGEVIIIEYSADGLAAACAGWGDTVSVVRRDIEVTAPGSPHYVYQACGN
jgi:hypothetical protein